MENQVSHLFFSYFIKNILYVSRIVRILFAEFFPDSVFYIVHRFLASSLFVDHYSLTHISSLELTYRVLKSCRHLVLRKRLLRFSYFCSDFFDEFHKLFDLCVSEQDSFKNFILRNLVGAGFYHHDGIFCTGDSYIHIALFALLHIRIDDVFAVNSSYANRAGRTAPRNIRNRESYR